MAIFVVIVVLAAILGSGTTSPSVVTTDATEISDSQATLSGDLTDLGTGSSVSVSFQWGTNSRSYPNETPAVARTTTGTFSIDITGLNQGMTYYFRAKAVGDGVSHGRERSFKTPELVIKEASELVLNVEDLKAGWTQSTLNDTTSDRTGSLSACKVSFAGFMAYLSVEVAVYPSVNSAKDVYSNEIPTNVSLDHPKIGDECFVDVRGVYAHSLVFRERNVVVWVWAAYEDVKSFAKKVEAKIE